MKEIKEGKKRGRMKIRKKCFTAELDGLTHQ
jgi:hypothetical protein